MPSPRRVMLVDDDALLLKMAGDELYRAGYAVQLCQHPTMAVTAAKTFAPQVVVLDQHMPIMSGREVLASLRAVPELAQTLVVFLSGAGSDRDDLRSLIAGAVDVWRKPFGAAHAQRLDTLFEHLVGQPYNPSDTERLRARVLGYYQREKTTGVLAVNPGTPFEGRAEFNLGALVTARLGPLAGVEAIDEMLTLDDGVWRFEFGGSSSPQPAPPLSATSTSRYGPKVLMVDDDAALRKLCGLQLKRAGFSVETADDGAEGHRKAANADFDVVVADLNMPVLDGWGMLKLLKADPRMRETPVLFLSAHDDYRETLKAARAGAHDYLRKTGHADELVARVKALAAPRQHVYAVLEAGRPIEGLELSWVGPIWLLRVLGELEASITLEATDDFGSYSLKIDNGRVREARAVSGTRVATGVLGLMSLVISRGARAVIKPLKPGTDESGPLLLDQLADACRRVADFEAKVTDELLATSSTIKLDLELYGLYLRVGSERDVRLLRALSEQNIKTDRLAAHLELPEAEVRQGLKELVRRGVISLN